MSATRPLLDEGVPLRRRGGQRKGDQREKSKPTLLTIPPSIAEAARAEAKRRGMSLSALVSTMLADFVRCERDEGRNAA